MTDLLSWLPSALDEHERIARASTLPIVSWYTTEDLAERLR
jgi:hypothetical protein